MSNGPRKCPPFCAGAAVLLQPGGLELAQDIREGNAFAYVVKKGDKAQLECTEVPVKWVVLENAEAQD